MPKLLILKKDDVIILSKDWEFKFRATSRGNAGFYTLWRQEYKQKNKESYPTLFLPINTKLKVINIYGQIYHYNPGDKNNVVEFQVISEPILLQKKTFYVDISQANKCHIYSNDDDE